ncbi:MAG: DUF1127 domain-containing protein [Bauldia sp.]
MTERLAKAYRAWVKYRETHAQLSGLSDRDLADIGIKRGSIQAVALAAAHQ